MSHVNWLDMLEWGDDQLEDLRFVGFAYLKQGSYDVALHFFKALNILKPNHAYDLQTLGAIYLQMGKNLEALNYIDKSLKIQPNHYPTLLNRAKALISIGYNKQALQHIKQLLYCPDKTIATQASALIATYS